MHPVVVIDVLDHLSTAENAKTSEEGVRSAERSQPFGSVGLIVLHVKHHPDGAGIDPSVTGEIDLDESRARACRVHVAPLRMEGHRASVGDVTGTFV